MIPIGIDISKQYVDVSIDGAKSVRYKKTRSGFAALVRSLPSEGISLMEATGTYHLSLAYYLHEHHYAVKIVNPYAAKCFANSTFSRAKTDAVDARLLSAFAASTTTRLWQPPSHASMLCRQKQTLIEHLSDANVRSKNVLESLAQYPEALQDTSAHAMLLESIAHTEERIAILRDEIENLQEQEFGAMAQHISSIPGIGKATAAKLITATDGFRSFDTVKQVIAFIGLCPDIQQSGSSVSSAQLTKRCHPTLRQDVYMCALSAKHWHPAAQCLYAKEMEKHGIHKRAIVRIMALLVRECFALAKKQMLFDKTIALKKIQHKKPS